MTLKEIAFAIATKLDRDVDEAFINELKFHINTVRNRLLRQTIIKNGVNPNILDTIVIDLEKVDYYEDLNLSTVSLNLMKSINELPRMIRLNNNTPFYSVTTYSGTVLPYNTLSSNIFMSHSQYGSKLPRYFLENNYLYSTLCNVNKLIIKGVKELVEDDCQMNEIYPIHIDLIPPLIQGVYESFRLYKEHKNSEVEITNVK